MRLHNHEEIRAAGRQSTSPRQLHPPSDEAQPLQLVAGCSATPVHCAAATAAAAALLNTSSPTCMFSIALAGCGIRCSQALAAGTCGVTAAGVCGFASDFKPTAGVASAAALLPSPPPAAAAAAAGAGVLPTLLRAAAAAAAGVRPAGVRSSASELCTAALLAARAHSTAGESMPAVLLRLLLPAALPELSQLVHSCGAVLENSLSSSALLPLRAAFLRASQ